MRHVFYNKEYFNGAASALYLLNCLAFFSLLVLIFVFLQADVFSMMAVSLGVLNKILISHDGNGPGRANFLLLDQFHNLFWN